MIDRIKEYFQPNLTKVLGRFEKTIRELEQIEANETRRQEQAAATIAAAQARAQAAQQAQQRAQTFKTNLNGLIGN